MPRFVAFCLMPSSGDASVLQEVIDDLATRFDTPSFAPHLTLYSGPLAPGESPESILAELVPADLPEQLPVLGVAVEELFTKTLYLRLAIDKRLSTFTENLRQACAEPSSYRLAPHLSLLYADLPLAEKRALAQQLESPLNLIRFDSIRVIEHPETIATEKDVEAFRDLCETECRPT